MKKTTLLFAILISAKLFSQVTPYTDPGSLEETFTGAMVGEDFTSSPTFPAVCGEVISTAANDCFAENGVIPGFEISSSNNGEIVLLPAGFLPSDNPTPRLGANAGANFTIISFTENNVFTVSHSLHIDNNDDFLYRVFNQEGVAIFDEVISFTPYFGVISTEPISRVEIENINNGGELLGDLNFGTNTLGLGENNINKLTYYPNPVDNVLNIQSAFAVTSLKVINMLGQMVFQDTVNATNAMLNTEKLTQGNYFVQAVLQNGSVQTFRIVKK